MNIKLGTQLNVALETPEEIRKNSYDLNTGFDKDDRWTLIVRYIGDISQIERDLNAIVTKLLGGFAIINIEAGKIYDLANNSSIIFIEKPKVFVQGRAGIKGFTSSCMSVPYFRLGLRGEGITVAIIDSGIDLKHPDFINDDGSSKLVGLWDQTIPGNPPINYNIGTFFEASDINSYLAGKIKFPSIDINGHGTEVAGIVTACTPDAKLLVVKLDTRDIDQVDTINLMQGIDFAVRYSMDYELPMVINLSYGNNSGDHRGNSVLERYIDQVAGLSKVTFVVGAGNDGNAGRHVSFNMGNESWYKREFFVNQGEKGIGIEIWRDVGDIVDISITTPSGEVVGPFNNYGQLMVFNVNGMDIRVLNNGPSPINTKLETYISIIPLNDFLEEGIWNISFNPKKIINGRLDIWLPVAGSTNTDIFFLSPTESTTLTIPSTAGNVITVGAYDSNAMSYASFSGRGFTADGLVKPDLVAPGVDIDTASVDGGYSIVSGTSFATPFVSSAAAMLMEYGIVRENDPFLYGEKVKAYLIKGTTNILEGDIIIPNVFAGWGALCVEKSVP